MNISILVFVQHQYIGLRRKENDCGGRGQAAVWRRQRRALDWPEVRKSGSHRANRQTFVSTLISLFCVPSRPSPPQYKASISQARPFLQSPSHPTSWAKSAEPACPMRARRVLARFLSDPSLTRLPTSWQNRPSLRATRARQVSPARFPKQ